MKILKLIPLLFALPLAAHAAVGTVNGSCQQGNVKVAVSGLQSTTTVQQSYPSCTVKVTLTGTSTLATIYSNSSMTPLANPFTAPTNGNFTFWAATGVGLDVTLSAGTSPNTLSAPITPYVAVFPGTTASGAGACVPSGTNGSLLYVNGTGCLPSGATTNTGGDILQPNGANSNRTYQITNTTVDLMTAANAIYVTLPPHTDTNGVTLPHCGDIAVAPGNYTTSSQITWIGNCVNFITEGVTVQDNHTGAGPMLHIDGSTVYSSDTSTGKIGGNNFTIVGNSAASISGIFYDQVDGPKLTAAITGYTGTGSACLVDFSNVDTTVPFARSVDHGQFNVTTSHCKTHWLRESASVGSGNAGPQAEVTNWTSDVYTGEIGLGILGTHFVLTDGILNWDCRVHDSGTCAGDAGTTNAYVNQTYNVKMHQFSGTGGTARNFTVTRWGGMGTFSNFPIIAGVPVMTDNDPHDISCGVVQNQANVPGAGGPEPRFTCYSVPGGTPGTTAFVSGFVATDGAPNTIGTNVTTILPYYIHATGDIQAGTMHVGGSGSGNQPCLMNGTNCAAAATYTIGATTLTPNGSNQQLSFQPPFTLPTIQLFGLAVGTPGSAYIEMGANVFQWNALTLHVDNNFPNKKASWGVSGNVPVISTTTGTSFELLNCSDSGGSSCPDSFSFGGAGVAYGSIGLGGASFANPWTFTATGVASTPPLSLTGAWFTGGSSTTTKPQLLVEPTGTTSTGWSTNGTGLGINGTVSNANPLDIQLNGVSKFSVNGIGVVTQTGVAGTNNWNASTAFNAGVNFPPIGTSNSGANFGSNLYQMTGSYWTGSSAANDVWQVNPILGTGANPSSTFTIAHAGSTGPASVSIPALKFSTTTTVAGLAACSAATKGMATAVTDATAPTYLGTVTGGSTVYTPVICNGTNWVTY